MSLLRNAETNPGLFGVGRPGRSPSTTAARHLVDFALPLAVLVAGAVITRYFADDAYISLRYARNLAGGQSLVFNPGGPRVEGYSDPLWVLTMTAPAMLHLNLVTTAQALCFLFSAADVVAAMALALAVFPDISRTSTIAVGVLTAGLSPMAVWSLGGLEGPAFALALTVACLGIVNDLREGQGRCWPFVAAVAVATLPVLHPEGVLFTLAFAVYLLWRNRRGLPATSAVALAAIALAPVVAYEAFRLVYFHQTLPNTYYVKASTVSPTSIIRGAKYLVKFGATRIPWLILIAIPAALAVTKNRFYRVVVVAGALETAFIVYAGGDDLVEYRMLVPLLPLIAVATVPLLSLIEREARRRQAHPGSRFAGVAVIAIAVAASALSIHQALPGIQFNRSVEHDRMAIGLYLRTHAPGARIATVAAGSIPYYSNLTTIDILGLNDTHIAHTAAHPGTHETEQKFDSAYLISLHPDLVPIGYDSLTTDPTAPTPAQLKSRYAPLSAQYYSVYVQLLDSTVGYDIRNVQVVPGRWLTVLVRRGFMLH